jgi:hypothetical protein
MAEAMDTEIGRLLDSVNALNRTDSTDIIFIGDNGDESSVSQVQGGAKGSIYQEGVSVPFVIAGPSVSGTNRISNALINTQDLFATVHEMMGNAGWPSLVPASKPVDSKSLIPILRNQRDSVRAWAFTEVFKIPTVPGDGKTMRNRLYKLLDFDNGTQKFYRIATDPTESTDLLIGNLTNEDLQNYSALCSAMTSLAGIHRFCDLTTGNAQLMSDSQTRAIPNPFRNSLRLANVNGLHNEFSRLTNPVGEVFYEGNNLEDQDFSWLPAGVYILQSVSIGAKSIKLIKPD